MPPPSMLTPEVLVSTTRRSPAIPNASGTLAIFSTSTHEIGVGTDKAIHVLDLSSGKERVVIKDDKAHDPQGDKGCTEVMMVDVMSAPCGMYPGAGPGPSNIALSQYGIAFAAPASETTNPLHADVSRIYLAELPHWGMLNVLPLLEISNHRPQNAATATSSNTDREISNSGLRYCSDPRFGPDYPYIAWIQCTYERQQDARIMLYDGTSLECVRDVFTDITQTQWHLVPSSVDFGADSSTLLITAQDHGRVALYRLRLQKGAVPEAVVRNGAVSAVYPLGRREDGRILVSASGLTETSMYRTADILGVAEPETISSATNGGSALGVSRTQIEEIHFPSSESRSVHAWVVKPPTFDRTKKYPLALLIHGGPPSAFRDWWDTKWNLLAWAAQGYVVVAPNILGSVGFGLKLTEGIYGNWRDGPYEDLVNCMTHLETEPYIDLDRAIAAGPSFGGYMIYMLMGRPLGRKFKAMVAHAGIFNLPSMMLSSDYRSLRESGAEHFRGSIAPGNSSSYAAMQACNPAQPEWLENWETPLLIVHNDLDYIVPVTEGLAAFNVCQMKGIPSRFVNFKDEGHHVMKEENSLEWHREVFRWVNHWTDNDGTGSGEATK